MTKDAAVERLKRQSTGPYKAPKVKYRCRICRFETLRLTRAWSHSCSHGPWLENGSRAADIQAFLSAHAHETKTEHPRGVRVYMS